MEPHLFLTVHAVPAEEDAVRERLARLADAAMDQGTRPIETFYSPGKTTARTLVQAANADDVRTLFETHGMPVTTVEPTERIFTELLELPRRGRYA